VSFGSMENGDFLSMQEQIRMAPWLNTFSKAIGLPLGMGDLKKMTAKHSAFSNPRQ
ncbi:hypothetical protein ALO_12920, partial [Acetonema longum DSM 6540]